MTNSNRLDSKKASNSQKVKSIETNVIRINFSEMTEQEKRKKAQQAISENVKKFYW